jgi:hypothetical protein
MTGLITFFIVFGVIAVYGFCSGVCHEILKQLNFGNGDFNDGVPRVILSICLWWLLLPGACGILAYRAWYARAEDRKELVPWEGDDT